MIELTDRLTRLATLPRAAAPGAQRRRSASSVASPPVTRALASRLSGSGLPLTTFGGRVPSGTMAHDRTEDVPARRPQLGRHRRARPRRGKALLRRTVRLDLHRRHARRGAGQLPDRHHRRRGRRRHRLAGLRRRAGRRGAPTSPSTTPTPPPRPSRPPAAPSRWRPSTPGPAAAWPSASTRAAPSSGCGRRASASVRNWSTCRVPGTSATCSPPTRTRPPSSTRRCSAGRSTTSGTRRWSAGPATATTSPRPSTPTSGSGKPRSPRRPGSRTPSRGCGSIPEGHPEHWQVTFAVADRDTSAATAEGLGATVLSIPRTSEWTRTATVRDPQGAELVLSQFTPPKGQPLARRRTMQTIEADYLVVGAGAMGMAFVDTADHRDRRDRRHRRPQRPARRALAHAPIPSSGCTSRRRTTA